jgi:hypothetical protein
MTFHPYAETYPLLEGEEYESFKADIAARGVREAIKYRMVSGDKQGLDGRNRLRACADLGIPCPEEKVSVEDADVESYIDSLNLHRRHLSREQRQERVLILRERGQSIRTIADTVGASPATVIKDIKDAEASAGVQNRTPEAGQPSTMSAKTVAGRDGKTYSSRRPRRRKAKPCESCARKGAPTCIPCRRAFPKGFPKSALKNGAVLWDWKAFEGSYGVLVREIDRLGNAYKAKESAEAEALRDHLRQYRENFLRWHKSLTGGQR